MRCATIKRGIPEKICLQRFLGKRKHAAERFRRRQMKGGERKSGVLTSIAVLKEIIADEKKEKKKEKSKVYALLFLRGFNKKRPKSSGAVFSAYQFVESNAEKIGEFYAKINVG